MLALLRRRNHLGASLSAYSSGACTRSLSISLSHPTYLLCSSNTSLGKTLVSTGLAASFLLKIPADQLLRRRFLYLKPLQTGFPSDSDSRFLLHKLSSLAARRSLLRPILASDAVLSPSSRETRALGLVTGDGDGGGDELVCETMFAWREAVSPHLAAERETGAVPDSSVVELLRRRLELGLGCHGEGEDFEAFCVVETAGGVASPGPSGTLQCDLYRSSFLLNSRLQSFYFTIMILKKVKRKF